MYVKIKQQEKQSFSCQMCIDEAYGTDYEYCTRDCLCNVDEQFGSLKTIICIFTILCFSKFILHFIVCLSELSHFRIPRLQVLTQNTLRKKVLSLYTAKV